MSGAQRSRTPQPPGTTVIVVSAGYVWRAPVSASTDSWPTVAYTYTPGAGGLAGGRVLVVGAVEIGASVTASVVVVDGDARAGPVALEGLVDAEGTGGVVEQQPPGDQPARGEDDDARPPRRSASGGRAC